MFAAMMKRIVNLVVLIFALQSCNAQPATTSHLTPATYQIITGAERLDILLPLLKDKRVALLVNQTAMVGTNHLVDTLLTYHNFSWAAVERESCFIEK